MSGWKVAALAAVVCVGTGCASSQDKSPQARVDTPTSGAPAEKPSALSYGTVTSMVKKGQTTQGDLLNLFGGPNISTTDGDGLESWTYERTATVTDTAATQDQSNLQAFFGGGAAIGPGAVGGGVTGGTSSQSSQRRTSYSTKTLTVVVKFNPDKTVREVYSRASTF